MKIKIYQGSTDGRDSCCVAAASWREAHWSMVQVCPKITLSGMREYWSVSQNREQTNAAMSAPGTVFRRVGISDEYEAWRP